ncbi:MAG: dihydrodipicolinate synthase family protein [Victivallales bacterium]|nr:dihydrodipicolinate synthase family protein [Victivallales bacterium]
MKRKFTGVMPALLTPFDAKGTILKDSVKALVDRLIGQGARGFYLCGSTGEGPILSARQRMTMAEYAIEAIAGRADAIVHTGSINQAEVLELTCHAEQIGATAVSSVPPCFYFNYSLAEIIDYYRRMAEHTSLPVILYATSMFKGVDVNAVVKELTRIPNVIGIKDTRAAYYDMWKLREECGPELNIINGPDESLACGLMMGADAGIGSTYNVMEDLYCGLYDSFQNQDIPLVQRYQTKINRVIRAILSHGLFASLKTYLSAQGIDMGVQAFPARQVSDDEAKAIVREMDELLARPL